MVPVLKADDSCLIENYRPISILPAFSKNLKKIVYNRISRYRTENMILSHNRFCIRDVKCLLLADDTSIFYQNRNLKILIDYLNNETRYVATWLKASKLFINAKTTKIIVFRTKQKKLLATSPLKIDNTIIEEVEDIIFRCFT